VYDNDDIGSADIDIDHLATILVVLPSWHLRRVIDETVDTGWITKSTYFLGQ
jgi:hypothetical protein